MLYVDSKLNFHFIESAPVLNKAKIEQCLRKLDEIKDEHDIDSPEIISLLNLIADFACVERSLLHDDVETMLAAIAQVNFKVTKADATKLAEPTESEQEFVSLKEYGYRLVAQLVNTELCDLPSAIKIASEQPCEQLEGVLEARIRFLNHDKIEEEKKAKKTAELEKVVDEQMSQGTFFNDLLDPSTAGKTRIDLSMLSQK